MLSTRAAMMPSTVNDENMTVDVVFGTDAEVRMWNWDIGDFMESMSFDEGHVRWTRLQNGAPLLDNHSSYNGTSSVIGVVERAWAEGGKGYATVRFDKGEAGAEAFRKVKDGIVTGISFGYRVYKYEKQLSAEGEIPKLRAIDWEPYEISLAPIQADPDARVRHSDEKVNNVTIIDVTLQSQGSERNDQTENQNPIAMAEPQENPVIEPVRTQAPEPQVDAKAVAEAERSRIKSITDMCRKFNMDDATLTELIDGGKSVDVARSVVMEKFEAADPAAHVRGNQPAVKADERDKFRKAAEEAVTLRVNPSAEVKNGGDELRGMNFVDLAKEVLERSGVATRGMNKREILSAATFGTRTQHTISDFPIILGNTINRQLQAAYDYQVPTFEPFCRRTSMSDMRPKTVAKLSGLLTNMTAIPEGGEYAATTVTEDKETYSLAKYGHKIGLTLEAMLNDDLSAFDRLPQAIALKARNVQSNIVYGILTGNPLMNDGVALFDAGHSNLGTAGAISDTTLEELYEKMNTQRGLEGDFINVEPKFLIVGPKNRATAMKFMNNLALADTVANQNIYQGSMQVIVEPRITTKNWFAAADPAAIDTIEYAFLEGENGLYTEQREGFDIDGIEIKARLFFAAKAIDHRGLFKNPHV
jgi:hypothetical protein